MQKAIPLVIFDETSNKHKVTVQGLDVLRSCRANRIAIVSLVGTYRTGKSYLLNKIAHLLCKRCVEMNGTKYHRDQRLLDHVNYVSKCVTAPEAFTVGSSLNSTTRGIYIYPIGIPFDDENEEYDITDVQVVLLDTEGFNSPDRNDGYDHKIYALSMLLSSVFVINGGPTFDRDSLHDFSMIIRVMQKMTGQNPDKKKADMLPSKAFFPSLYWAMRNYGGLAFVNPATGRPQSAVEHLKMSLDSFQSWSKTECHFNDFKSVACFPLCAPSNNPSVLAELSFVKDELLSQDFIKGCDEMVKTIIHDALKRPKSIEGFRLDAYMVEDILCGFVEAMNQSPSSVPVLAPVWEKVVIGKTKDVLSDTMFTWESDVQELEPYFPLQRRRRGSLDPHPKAGKKVDRMLDPHRMSSYLQGLVEVVKDLYDEWRTHSVYDSEVDTFAAFLNDAKAEMKAMVEENMARFKRSELYTAIMARISPPDVKESSKQKKEEPPLAIESMVEEWRSQTSKLVQEFIQHPSPRSTMCAVKSLEDVSCETVEMIGREALKGKLAAIVDSLPIDCVANAVHGEIAVNGEVSVDMYNTHEMQMSALAAQTDALREENTALRLQMESTTSLMVALRQENHMLKTQMSMLHEENAMFKSLRDLEIVGRQRMEAQVEAMRRAHEEMVAKIRILLDDANKQPEKQAAVPPELVLRIKMPPRNIQH